jgi:probable blue pigment (indigoidine) exporter
MPALASNKLKYQLIAAGILFAVFWSSAAAATKIGLQSAQPFVVALPRFFIAAIIMLFIAHIILKKRLPATKEWKHLAIYGLLNISIYLGLYVVSMQYVSAGIGSLSVAINPVLISLMASVWLNQPIKREAVISLLLCCLGIFIAALPLFESSYATPGGLCILFISTISYSAGAVYFSKQEWSNLHILAINGWQTLFGGIFLLPVFFFTYQSNKNHFDFKWMSTVLWLAIMVSILAVQLWLFHLKHDAVKAAFWLFLCPVSGFIIAAVMLHEPISIYTIVGVILVVAGLYIIQKKKDETILNEVVD